MNQPGANISTIQDRGKAAEAAWVKTQEANKNKPKN